MSVFTTNLIVHEALHFLIALIVATFVFWRYRDWRLIPSCFVPGFLVDLDHFLDYFLYFGLNFNWSHLLNVHAYMEPAGKIYVILHGWEFIPLFWLIGRWIGRKKKVKGLEWALSLSYLGHLLLDNFSFTHHPLSYSFLYRLFNQFSSSTF